MQELIRTTKPVISESVNCGDFTHMAVQMSAIGADEQRRVKAHAVLEGSLDGLGWFTIADLTVDGIGYATDGGTFETLWRFIRTSIKSISGGTTVSVYLAKRG